MPAPSWLHAELSARYFPAVQILGTEPRRAKAALHAVSSIPKDVPAQGLGHKAAMAALPNSNLSQDSWQCRAAATKAMR